MYNDCHQYKKVHSDCLKRLYIRKIRLSEVRRQIVSDWKSNCTEGSVAEVGVRLTDA